MPTTVGFGVSDTLRSIFDGLSQAEGLNGQKYSDINIKKVRQYVSCRNYSKVSLELVYLCWAIVNAYPVRRGASKLEAFFWLDEAYGPRRFREAFRQGWQDSSGSVTLSEQFLMLELANNGLTQTTFNISPSRVGVLAVMMEFIITVDPSLIHTLQTSLLKANAKTIDQVAKQLQKSIYHFLKSHLPEAQIQTRYRYFETWLKQNAKTPSSLDDQDIMTFWQDASQDQQAQSYVLYSTALFDTLDALDAINVVQTQQGICFANSFGTGGFDSGEDSAEVDLERINGSAVDELSETVLGEQVGSLLFGESGQELELNALCQAPKCLKQEQAQWLRPLSTYPVYSRRFVLSFLRLQVFSPWQSVLVQAKRKSQDTLAEKLAEAPMQGYTLYQGQSAELHETLRYTENCLLYVLLEGDPQRACAELLQKLPQQQLAPIAGFLAQLIEQTESSWPSVIKQLSLRFVAFSQLVQTLQRAYKKNNKAGFTTLPEEEELDPYIEALQQITALQALLNKHQEDIAQLDQATLTLSSIFSSDVCIFTKRFNALYGDLYAN